jgi:hypothetical protein
MTLFTIQEAARAVGARYQRVWESLANGWIKPETKIGKRVALSDQNLDELKSLFAKRDAVRNGGR